MRTDLRFLLTFALLLSLPSQGAGLPGDHFAVSPVVIEGEGASGATLALDYSLRGVMFKKIFSGDAGNEALTPEAVANAVGGSLVVGYKGQGTFAASAEKNPRNLVDLLVDAQLLYSSGRGTVSGGAFLKYEADQSFRNKQAVYGGRLTAGKMGLLATTDVLVLDANYGRVDPTTDKGRSQALNDANPRPYYRWDFEALYMYPLKFKPFESLELNYRHYREVNAPDAIKIVNMDTSTLRTVRLGLSKDLFIAYSKGNLPFDKTSDKIFEVGFSYKLQ